MGVKKSNFELNLLRRKNWPLKMILKSKPPPTRTYPAVVGEEFLALDLV